MSALDSIVVFETSKFWPRAGERLIGLRQVLKGLWLMCLSYRVVLHLALGKHWWI
jgi:hypothetical protein